MFGYVTINPESLDESQKKRYEAFYCGLCQTLSERYGAIGRATLSYDMTFLYLLLSSLYEPEEQASAGRCLPHPVKPRGRVINSLAGYCADMNIALAYHKCRDDWNDERSVPGRAEAALLRKAYKQVEERYPDKCRAIEDCLRQISGAEREGILEPDLPTNLTARMLGEIYRYRDDHWADTLRTVGEALGRFVYLMDAYDDLPADRKRGRYNPLTRYAQQDDYEALCKESLTLLIAECTSAFEELPLLQDVELMRNILYSGVWMRYAARQNRADRKQGKIKRKEDGHEGPL